MQFVPDFKPVSDGLPPSLAARKDEIFYQRRAAGMNVQFIRETYGALDEWSFNSVERAQAFAASLERQGVPFAMSA